MCYWRRVCNVYTKCRHEISLPDELIDCYSLTCKFSSVHPQDCVAPRCTKSCWQYRQYPQQYAPQIDNYCPNCIRAGLSSR